MATTVSAACKLLKTKNCPTLEIIQSTGTAALVLLTAVSYLLVATLGSQRRRSTSWFIQKGLLVAHTLSFPLGAYTLGLMQSHSQGESNVYPIWAISLFILHCSANTSYRLDGTKQVTRIHYQLFLYYAYCSVLLTTGRHGDYNSSFVYTFMAATNKLTLVQAPWVLSSRSWELNKTVADYMYDEHTKGEFFPATMEGCHYLVAWPLKKCKLDATSYANQLTGCGDEVIDIEKIWLCNSMSLDQELKDTCLSFSLFHLLRRRFFGFSFGESRERAHDFVFKGLLLENEEGHTDCDRVFRVIETELAFMYDFFFTRSAVTYYGLTYYGSSAETILSFLSVLFLSITIALTVGTQEITNTERVISLVVIASAAFVELLQLLLYWTSIWSRVSFVCQHLREEARRNTIGCCSYCCYIIIIIRLNGLLAKIGVHCAPNKHYWQHKLGKYSLLDFTPTSRGCFDTSSLLKVRGKHGKPIEVPAQVKKALVYALKHTNGELTNGKSSLVSNVAGHLSWACAREVRWASDTSCIIMTWHIATWYCEMGTTRYGGPSYTDDAGAQLKIHVGVATTLSKYCAYLVVHAPKLLPGHHYDTSRLFDAVVVEANRFLPTSMRRRRRAKYEALRNYGLEESEATIFQSGAKLGKQLGEIQDVTRRWKVLADFWSEMMLYIAPSDDVNEHIDHLTRGGELITHLWALLSHAGILQRDQPSRSHHPHAQTTSSSHQEIEQDSTSHGGNTTTSQLAHHFPTPTSPAHHFPADNLQMMSGVSPQDTLQAATLMQQGPVPPEIIKENECRIDVPEASISMQESPRSLNHSV